MHVLYVYAFLQIIFEVLPISSSGSVLVWTTVLQNLFPLESMQCYVPDFDFLLHIPTFLVLAVFFFKEWFYYVRRLGAHKREWVALGLRCALADIFTATFYFFWKAYGKEFFPLGVGFLCTTLVLLSLKSVKSMRGTLVALTTFDAAVLGIVQGFSLLPGISRLAATFTAGVWLGYSPVAALWYSFLIQVPLIGCAVLQVVWHMWQQQAVPTYLTDPLLYAVTISASVVSFCLLSVLFAMVKRGSVWKFAWYTGLLTLFTW